MNNLRYLLALGLALLLSTACNVLEQEPLDSITPDLAFEDGNAAEAAMNGLYSQLQDADYYGAYFQYIAENYSDVATYLGFFIAFRDADMGVIPSTNNGIEVIWLGAYRAINVANEIIAAVPEIEDESLSAERQAEMVAQARCIRGMAYLDLLTYFGEHWDEGSPYGLPLVTQSTGSDFANIELIPRSSVAETYAFIIADLQAAEAALPDSDDRGYVSKGLATGLLARTYLYQGEYALAEAKATELIDHPNYTLNPDYLDIFQSDLTSESVFELIFTAQDPSDLALFTLLRDEVRPDPDFVASFQDGDVRRQLIGPIEGEDRDRFLKAEDVATDANPAYVMRIAELYLIRAEARYRLGQPEGALDDINVIRKRAGLAAHNSTANLKQKLLDEWGWEFYQEGQRFRALVRLDEIGNVLDMEAFRAIYPIPFRELTIEGTLIEQNPGYVNP